MRRSRQFSLRVFLALAVMTGIVLAVWGSSVRRQRSATTAIAEMGGRITYREAPAFIPRVLVDALGDDCFCDVECITLYPSRESLADVQILPLKELPDLKRLAIWPGAKGKAVASEDAPGGLSDDGVEFLLTNLQSLEHLSLLHARISKATERKLLSTKRITSLQYEISPAYGGGSGGGAYP